MTETQSESQQDQQKSEDQPVYRSSLHEAIRTKLDPEAIWLSDDDISMVARIACGDRRRTIHKCLLGMWYKAQRLKNKEAAVAFRHKLTAFEDGRLVI